MPVPNSPRGDHNVALSAPQRGLQADRIPFALGLHNRFRGRKPHQNGYLHCCIMMGTSKLASPCPVVINSDGTFGTGRIISTFKGRSPGPQSFLPGPQGPLKGAPRRASARPLVLQAPALGPYGNLVPTGPPGPKGSPVGRYFPPPLQGSQGRQLVLQPPLGLPGILVPRFSTWSPRSEGPQVSWSNRAARVAPGPNHHGVQCPCLGSKRVQAHASPPNCYTLKVLYLASVKAKRVGGQTTRYACIARIKIRTHPESAPAKTKQAGIFNNQPSRPYLPRGGPPPLVLFPVRLTLNTPL